MRLADAGVNLAAWVRDYAYALRWQSAGILRRLNPQDYRRPEAEQPAVVLIPGVYERWTFLLPVANAIHGLVAVNTPFDGSWLARLLPLPALRVFLPNSPELVELRTWSQVDRDIVAIYGRFDPHIPGGGHLEGAHNVKLETRGHFLPLGDHRVHSAILSGIRHLTDR